jgi:hypothetical protein
MDCYDARVADVRVLVRPLDIAFKRTKSASEHYTAKVTETQPLFLPSWPDTVAVGDLKLHRKAHFGSAPPTFDEQKDSISVESLLRAWGVLTPPAQIGVLAVPFPLAFLICKRMWDRILILARWHRAFGLHRSMRVEHGRPGPVPGWPLATATLWHHVGQNEPADQHAPEDPLNCEALDQLAAVLRNVSTLLPDGAPRHDCMSAARRLSRWSSSLADADAEEGGLHSRFRHRSLKLITAIRLTRDIKGGPRNLLSVVKKCLILAVPSILAKSLIESLEQPENSTIPSASIIRRYELALDIAMHLLVQSRSRVDTVFRYGHADSSPIAGYDWMWSQYVEVKEGHLAQTYAAVVKLQSAISLWAEDVNRRKGEDRQKRHCPIFMVSASGI